MAAVVGLARGDLLALRLCRARMARGRAPCPASAGAARDDGLALRLPGLRETASGSEELKIEFERLEALYRQVGRSALTGWWSLRIAAGAASAETAEQVASMLCNTTELRELPLPAPVRLRYH